MARSQVVRLALGLALASLMIVVAVPAVPAHAADPWPSKTVTILAPSGPGSPPDLIARIAVEQLQAEFGKPFVVENKVGAGGNIAAAASAKSPADNPQFAVVLAGPMIINPAMMDTGYNPKRDLVPVTMLATQTSIFVANSSLNLNSVRDVLEYVRARPGQVNYAISGIGTVSHLGMELLAQLRDLKLTQIVYRSSPEAATSIAAGETMIGLLPPVAVTEFASQGKLTMIAVTSKERWSYFPQLPTFQEAGVADFEALAWMALVAPAGTAPEIVNGVSAAIRRSFAKPDVQEKLRRMQFDHVAMNPAELASYFKEEEDRWLPMMRRAGIRPQ